MAKFKKDIFGNVIYSRSRKVVREYVDRINGYMQEFIDPTERVLLRQHKVRIVFPRYYKVSEYDDGTRDYTNV